MDILQWFQNLQDPAQGAVVSAVISAVVALAVSLASTSASRGLERLKADLARGAASDQARISYEYEARKRLYSEIEPLFFLLFEAAEGSYYRVSSLARTQRQGYLGEHEGSWLSQEGYYLRSTVYRIFLPLVIFRIIQRNATFVDIDLDQKIRTRYFLLKAGYYAATDDFVFASLEPALPYSPNVPDWRDKVKFKPDEYKRQGLVIGHLDRLLDALVLDDDGSHRPMNYGEFESKYHDDQVFKVAVSEAMKLFLGFDFPNRPVLARFLSAHACIMRLLLLTYARDLRQEEVLEAFHAFIGSREARSELSWNFSEENDHLLIVSNYIEERLRRMTPLGYDVR